MVLEPQSTGTDASPGDTLGRYRIVRRIATGGMATVYLGHAFAVGGFRRTVAVKVCHAHLRDDPQFAAMFLDEARLAARIHHPNVVATLDVANEPVLYLVMDYVDGVTLGELLRLQHGQGAPLAPSLVLRIAGDLLAGLEAAHALRDDAGRPLRIVHRDVSPQNVLVGADGIARLTDFGIARAEARVAQTRTGEIKGKVGYMAPEQLDGGEASVQSDVYAAGVVLWEALTGQRLFEAATDAATVRAVLTGVTEHPRARAEGVSDALDAVVMRALDRDPARRFATAAAFADALEHVGLDAATPRLLGARVRALVDPTPLDGAARTPGVPALGAFDPPVDAPPATAPGTTVATQPAPVAPRGRSIALVAAAAMALLASLVFAAAGLVRTRDVRASAAPPVRAIAPAAAAAVALAPPVAPQPVAARPVAPPPVAIARPQPARRAAQTHHAHHATRRAAPSTTSTTVPRFRPGAV